MGLVAAAGAVWAWRRAKTGLPVWPAATFLLILTGVQIVSSMMPMNPDPVRTGAMTLGVYLLVTAIAWLVERRSGRAA
jgi:heme A synthase